MGEKRKKIIKGGEKLKKLIILIELIMIILLLIATNPEAETEGKYFIMTVTFYSQHPNCIADKWNDVLTATMTTIREGVVAINVDYIDGKWLVKSPLNLGDKIHIEGLGNFSVEDTGYFTDTDYKQDFWNVDVYVKDHEQAVKGGRELRKVYIIEGGE